MQLLMLSFVIGSFPLSQRWRYWLLHHRRWKVWWINWPQSRKQWYATCTKPNQLPSMAVFTPGFTMSCVLGDPITTAKTFTPVSIMCLQGDHLYSLQFALQETCSQPHPRPPRQVVRVDASRMRSRNERKQGKSYSSDYVLSFLGNWPKPQSPQSPGCNVSNTEIRRGRTF